jgi:hypothetical protein
MIDFGELLGELNILPRKERPAPLAWPTYTRDTDGFTYLSQVKEACRRRPTTFALVEALEAVALTGVAAQEVLRLTQAKQPLPISVGVSFIHFGKGDSPAEPQEVRLRPHLAQEAAQKFAAAESRLYDRAEANEAVSFLHLSRQLFEKRLHLSGEYVNYEPRQLARGFRPLQEISEKLGIPPQVANGISWAVAGQVLGKGYQPQTMKAYR